MHIPAVFHCTNKRKVWTFVRSTSIAKGNPVKWGVLHVACESFGLPKELILSLKLIKHTYLCQKSYSFLSIRLRKLAELDITYLIDCGHIFFKQWKSIVSVFVFINYPLVSLIGSFLVFVLICAVGWCFIQIVF